MDRARSNRGAGTVEVALVAPNMCEVVEADGGGGMVGAQAGLAIAKARSRRLRAASRSPWS